MKTSSIDWNHGHPWEFPIASLLSICRSKWTTRPVKQKHHPPLHTRHHHVLEKCLYSRTGAAAVRWDPAIARLRTRAKIAHIFSSAFAISCCSRPTVRSSAGRRGQIVNRVAHVGDCEDSLRRIATVEPRPDGRRCRWRLNYAQLVPWWLLSPRFGQQGRAITVGNASNFI